MGHTDYIVRFKGDYSALQKDLNKINAETTKLEDDEVIIKLNYDGNIKEFNKVFDQISKMHPELGIQFQYNVNEKLLRQETDKLKQLSDLKLDIDDNKVQNKLENLADNVKVALKNNLSKEDITSRLKEFFGYYNTATKAGAKNIQPVFDQLVYGLEDSFKLAEDDIKNLFDEIWEGNDIKPIELFKIDKSLTQDISDAQERVNDIKDTLDNLEKKGASKTGLPSELEQVQDEIKILKSDLGDMQEQLKNLSGDAFDAMTQQIKETNKQLEFALQMVSNLKAALKNNGIKSDDSVGGIIQQWQDEEVTKSRERYTAFNSQSKKTSGAHVAATAEGVGMKLMRSAIEEMGEEADGTIHSHPQKYAAFSDDDIEIYYGLIQDGITQQVVASTKQAISLDMDKVNPEKSEEVVKLIRSRYNEIDNKLLNNLQLSTEEIKEQVIALLNIESDNPIENAVFRTIKENYDDLFDGIMNLDEFDEMIETNMDYILKQIPQFKALPTSEKNPITQRMGNFGDLLHDAVVSGVAENAQMEYQKVLQEVFTNPTFLKAGETSAIKIEALSDFIDWGSINETAADAAQKAADALQEAQNSNSPAELTKPLGKDFGEGYAEGIRESLPDIVEACKDIVMGAYNALKETSDAKNGEGNNFLDIFINNLKESLDNAAPTIQEKINEVFSKINIDNKSEKSSLSSIGSEDFQSQFQNAINETGEYIIKVYGELIDDFKSRLQNSIDETGIYHVDIEGWLYDTFHDGLQRDIDGQERYNIEVNGKLVETFKDIIQEAIDGLGAFPIEVKPYIRKGSEIEEVDLPGGNKTNLSSGTTTTTLSTIDEITQAEDRMGNEAQEATDQARQGLAKMREEAEILLTIYRGVDQAATQFATINDKPGTFFSFDKNLAKQYAGFSGELLEATADFKDALYIDGKGSDWYNFEYLGNGADEASQKIIALSQKIRNIQEELSSNHWKELGDIGISHSDFTRTNSSTGEVFSVDTPYYMYKEDEYDFIIPLIEKENALESIHNEEVKQLVIELYEAEKAYKRISDAQDNMYGRHSTDEFAELGKKNGYNSIIFENIKDSFDKISSVSDVGVILDNAIIKQDQFTNSINETTEALKNQASNETTNLSSGTTTPSQQFDNEVQQNLVMLENYKNTVAEIDRLKLEPETDETKAKLEELNKLADYFVSKITVIRGENGDEVNTSMMLGWGASGGWSERLKRDYSEEQRKEFLSVAKERSGLQISSVASEFHGISDEITNIEAKSEGLRNALVKDLIESSAYVSKLRAAYLGVAEANDELKTAKPGSEDFKDYTDQLNTFLSKYPELEKFKDALGYYDKAPEFVKSDDWLDFLATLPQAHTYLESIGYDFDKINQVSNETPVSTESTNAETKALLSKKEIVEQLRAELNLTKKAAEDLFDQQGYAKTDNRYQIEQAAVDELIASLKEKQQTEESTNTTGTSAITASMEEEKNAISSAVDAEKQKFDELKNKISKTIPSAIEKKNKAFEKERNLVAKIVEDEVDYMAYLKDSIDDTTEAIGKQQNTVKNLKTDSGSKKKKNKSNEVDVDALLQQHYTEQRRNYFQSIGQKSDIQKDMSAYYTQLEKESAKAYSNAETKATSLLKKVEKLKNSGKYSQSFQAELEGAEAELNTFLSQLKNGTISFEDVNDRITALGDNIENTLAKKAFKEVKLAAEKSLTNVGLKIDQIIAKNTAMGEEFKSRFMALKDRLGTAETVADVQKITAAVNTLESELITAGKTGVSFFDQVKQRLRDMNSKYIAQYFSFQDIIRYARQAFTTIQDLNIQMVELAKVSEQSLEQIKGDFQSYAETAKDLGSTITDTISATADWARLGYNVPDAKELARVALLYKNVGDGIDITAANESLISTLQGYQMQADEAEHIVDVFNEVANNYAIDTAGIGEALQRSAASLNAANTSLEQSVALVTAANTVVQNPESVGTTFKTLSARIRGSKTDLEELGEEADEFTETTSKLQGLVKSLTGFDILEADQKTYKSIYDILIGIGKEWKNLDDIEQASLGEALAGKFYYQDM